MECFLYHICREEDKGVLTRGYIGVSNDPSRRWKNQLYQSNAHLKNSFKKYTDIIRYIVTGGSTSEMLRMEKYLRPIKNIGWNVEAGGGLPPSKAGVKLSTEHKLKIGEANSIAKKGKPCTNGGGDWTQAKRERQRNITLGRVQSEETKAKKRAAMLGKVYPEITCPHCGKVGRGGSMERYHLDNCKLREVGNE